MGEEREGEREPAGSLDSGGPTSIVEPTPGDRVPIKNRFAAEFVFAPRHFRRYRIFWFLTPDFRPRFFFFFFFSFS